MQIFLQNQDEKTIVLKIQPFQKIKGVKEQVSRLFKIPVCFQRFVLNSSELDDDNKCFNDYNITSGSTLQLLLRLKGGMGASQSKGSLPHDIKDIQCINSIFNAHKSRLTN